MFQLFWQIIIFINLGTDVASQQEFTSCLKETLSGLAQNADNLQVNPLWVSHIAM